MEEKNLGYNPNDIDSIYKYAVQLENKTFLEVLEEKSNLNSEALTAYANKLRKGGLGNLLEEVYFGYKANSVQDADFAEVGVELKASPYEVTKKGELRAGERLVLTMINYNGPVEDDFYHSHLWKKIRLILLIYYWRNKQLNDNLLYKIGFVRLFTPPEADLEIIKQDYDYIVTKIKAGLAHELSEGDTMYLGACTKGATAEKSTVPQYYGDKIPARKRAFSFKNSYMTYVLNHYIAGKTSDNSIIKDAIQIKEKTFEEVIQEIVSDYVGKTDKELCEKFGREYNNNKSQWHELTCKILGIRDEHADEFVKANIKVKAVRVENNEKIVESMSFPPFKFLDIVKEEYEDSAFHEYFEETKLLFVVWKKDDDVYRLQGSILWHMPYEDLEIVARREWEKYKKTIEQGIRLEKYIDKVGKICFKNNLPKMTETEIIHVRPHAQKAAYRFNNGEEYGNVERDANMLPNGEYMTTQSFWLNNKYVVLQIDDLWKK